MRCASLNGTMMYEGRHKISFATIRFLVLARTIRPEFRGFGFGRVVAMLDG